MLFRVNQQIVLKLIFKKVNLPSDILLTQCGSNNSPKYLTDTTLLNLELVFIDGSSLTYKMLLVNL